MLVHVRVLGDPAGVSRRLLPVGPWAGTQHPRAMGRPQQTIDEICPTQCWYNPMGKLPLGRWFFFMLSIHRITDREFRQFSVVHRIQLAHMPTKRWDTVSYSEKRLVRGHGLEHKDKIPFST